MDRYGHQRAGIAMAQGIWTEELVIWYYGMCYILIVWGQIWLVLRSVVKLIWLYVNYGNDATHKRYEFNMDVR